MLSSASVIRRQLEKTISPEDVKEAIDSYKQLKRLSPSPTSIHIQELERFYSELNLSNPLSETNLYTLTKLIMTASDDETNSPKTFSAIRKLYNKMENFRDCISWYRGDIQVFNAFIKHPELYEYVKIIRDKYGDKPAASVILHHPNALEHLAKIPIEVENEEPSKKVLYFYYCEKIKPHYQFLPDVCYCLDSLEYHHEQIYSTPARKIPDYQLEPQEAKIYIVPLIRRDDYFRKNSNLNREYTAELNSEKNENFIFKYMKSAHNLEYIFRKLHYCMIGKAKQNQAEDLVRSETKESTTPEAFMELAQAFELLIGIKVEKKFSKKSEHHADFIVTLCKPEHRMHARQMALAAIEFDKNNELNAAKVALIDQNPSRIHFICQTLNLLKSAGLQTEMSHSIYQHASEFTETVVTIFKKLHEAKPQRLLTKPNVENVLANLSNANQILGKLISPVTQTSFNELIQSVSAPPAYASTCSP